MQIWNLSNLTFFFLKLCPVPLDPDHTMRILCILYKTCGHLFFFVITEIPQSTLFMYCLNLWEIKQCAFAKQKMLYFLIQMSMWGSTCRGQRRSWTRSCKKRKPCTGACFPPARKAAQSGETKPRELVREFSLPANQQNRETVLTFNWSHLKNVHNVDVSPLFVRICALGFKNRASCKILDGDQEKNKADAAKNGS